MTEEIVHCSVIDVYAMQFEVADVIERAADFDVDDETYEVVVNALDNVQYTTAITVSDQVESVGESK